MNLIFNGIVAVVIGGLGILYNHKVISFYSDPKLKENGLFSGPEFWLFDVMFGAIIVMGIFLFYLAYEPKKH